MYFFSEYDNYRGAGGHITSDAESDFAHEDDSEVCSEINILHCPQILYNLKLLIYFVENCKKISEKKYRLDCSPQVGGVLDQVRSNTE